MHAALREPLAEERRLNLPKNGKHQVSIMNWVKDAHTEIKTRGWDTVFAKVANQSSASFCAGGRSLS